MAGSALLRNKESEAAGVPVGQSGAWKVERFQVEQHSIERLQIAMSGRLAPEPGEYTRLLRGGTVVMSDTIAELHDLYGFDYKVESLNAERVLIHGLGLGCAVRMALRHGCVRHIDVVEQSPDVIKLVAGSLDDPRVRIILADAYTHRFAAGVRWDVAWHDIWDDLCEDNLPMVAKLKRRYGRRVRWQGAWGEHFVRSRARRDRLW